MNENEKLKAVLGGGGGEVPRAGDAGVGGVAVEGK